MTRKHLVGRRAAKFLSDLQFAVLASAALTACGGGDTTEAPDLVAAMAAVQDELMPTYHLAPVELADPSEGDQDPLVARTAPVLEGMASLSTALLSTDVISQYTQELASTNVPAVRRQAATPAATTTNVVLYTPAQIRAAYQLPVANATIPVSSSDRAALGAGQTIYLVDAYDNPNALIDLNTFSKAFGLPLCTNVTVAASATLPLAPASTTAGCTFSVVYAGATSGRVATPPAYNASWATEIALDVQSAHAIAPLARIVLIEAPSSFVSALGNGVMIANAMGPGVVSMSFASPERPWVTSLESLFTGKGMQYTAATGDSGAQVNWPAVSQHVLATGGTTLKLSGANRSETAWAKSGGGTSAYITVPTYQAALSPAVAMRRVPDVAFDSDPYTGQYLALTAPGKTVSYFSAGGTSIASPQWAGLLAITAAQRALSGLPTLTSVQSALYLNLLPSANAYSLAFFDVLTGTNGTCLSCAAAKGYDATTGMGTPNSTYLVGQLASIEQQLATGPGGATFTPR